MELHYRIAGDFKPDAHLIGSNTILQGLDQFGDETEIEDYDDFIKPERSEEIPLWGIIDTQGKLEGKLHHIRKSEFCRDLVVFVSKITPPSYRTYLKERDYSSFRVGKNKADLLSVLEILARDYESSTVLTDTGKILGNLLLNEGYIQVISLLIHPVLVGSKSYPIFDGLKDDIEIELDKVEVLEEIYPWLTYRVLNGTKFNS